MNKKILELRVNNNKKDLEKYIQSQWSFKTLISIVIFIFVLVFVVKDLEINFIKLISDSSKYFGDILSRMLPPDFSNLSQLIYAMFETIEIAFLGTFIAIVLSIPLGLFSAKNLAPNNFVYLVCKTIVIFFRAIPEFIIAMILVIAVGFGAIPGVLALGFHTMGFLAKFYAEDVEHVNKGPIEALKAQAIASRMTKGKASLLEDKICRSIAFITNSILLSIPKSNKLSFRPRFSILLTSSLF